MKSNAVVDETPVSAFIHEMRDALARRVAAGWLRRRSLTARCWRLCADTWGLMPVTLAGVGPGLILAAERPARWTVSSRPPGRMRTDV